MVALFATSTEINALSSFEGLHCISTLRSEFYCVLFKDTKLAQGFTSSGIGH